ncbi:MAG: hypothetical protein NTZ56_11755 [Acidobacteria bacterium]|nr:hypothetical protein [Acidobacteriota bacterium]
MSDQSIQALVVTTVGDRPIESVAQDLRAAGFDVQQVLEFVESITGMAPASKVEEFRRIAGVADVTVDHPIDIGPPGAAIS